MTETSDVGTVGLLAVGSPPVLPPPPGSSTDDVFVPLHDSTWDATVIDWLMQRVGPQVVDHPDFLESIEHYRLALLFPNRYVVFRDVVDSGEDHYRLLRREIFCHTPDIAVARAFLRRIPDSEVGQFHFEWNDGGDIAHV